MHSKCTVNAFCQAGHLKEDLNIINRILRTMYSYTLVSNVALMVPNFTATFEDISMHYEDIEAEVLIAISEKKDEDYNKLKDRITSLLATLKDSNVFKDYSEFVQSQESLGILENNLVRDLSQSVEFQNAITRSNNQITASVNSKADEKIKDFKEAYRKQIEQEYKIKLEKMQKKVDEHDKQKQESESQLEEYKAHILELEVDKRQLLGGSFHSSRCEKIYSETVKKNIEFSLDTWFNIDTKKEKHK